MQHRGLILVVAALAFTGCGSDDAADAGAPSDAADAAGASDAAGIVDARFGYDSRPVNVSCKAPPRPTPSGSVVLQQVFGTIAFNKPLQLLQAPGEPDRYYVVEQDGVVKAFAAGDLVATTVYAYPPYPASQIANGGEMGLMGIAFAPDWQQSRIAYVSRTDWLGATNNIRSVIARVHSTDGGLTFDKATEEEILSLDQPYQNHHGGNIVFGPDGKFYVGFGDGGGGGDPSGNGQKHGVLQGKILRLDVGSTGTYTVPLDNPFVGVTGYKEEIWALGFRNPWRWNFDRANGVLWLGDVGEVTHEEVDIVERGGNYGWGVREGFSCFFPATGCPTIGMIDPVVDYPHPEGMSVTGGYVYRGSALPGLAGSYVFGDFGTGSIWTIATDDTGVAHKQLVLQSALAISSFGEDLEHELYVVDYGGSIWKLTPASGAATADLPAKLSLTGCVDPADPTQPAPGLIPYEINAPFWSDGAEKERWIAVPEGTSAVVGADGDLDFPIGTVAMKKFTLGGTAIETRLFMRHSDGVWAGYSYEWDADGKDATLLVGGKQKTIGTQQWTYPSRGECLRCHTAAAGRTLGLELAQLAARVELYPQTARRAPQLDTWAHIGLLDRPLARGKLRALPVPTGPEADLAPAQLEPRARAWLHTNCAMCHRPGGPGLGSHDLRFDRSFADTRLCGTPPVLGDLGVRGARLITPSDPSHSIVYLRAEAALSGRMPPLASTVIDAAGTKLLADWINAIISCP